MGFVSKLAGSGFLGPQAMMVGSLFKKDKKKDKPIEPTSSLVTEGFDNRPPEPSLMNRRY